MANGGEDENPPRVEIEVDVGPEQVEQRVDDLRHAKGMSKVVIGIG